MSALSYAIRPATGIQPFQIDVSQAALDDVNVRLARARRPVAPAGAGGTRGLPPHHLRELVDYWGTSYDWRQHEAELNRYPQFMTTINGQAIHFLHVVSPEPDALPLILGHGGLGSPVEFLDGVGPLAHPRAFGDDPADAFHVVVPSLSGLGVAHPTDAGWGAGRITPPFAALMARLGYDRYHVHVNEATQATPRQPPARGVADSPIDYLAWFLDTVPAWTHSSTVPERSIGRDRLLTGVMLSWFDTAGSSPTSHAAADAHRQDDADRALAIGDASEIGRGGRLAAMATPDRFVDDLRAVVRPFRHADRAVPAHNNGAPRTHGIRGPITSSLPNTIVGESGRGSTRHAARSHRKSTGERG